MPDALQQSMTILDWMEQTGLGVWVATSSHGYYVMLAIHSIGLAMLVGAVTVIDLRLLGAVRGISIEALSNFVKFAWWGWVINALSGVAIFLSEANKAFYHNMFRWKMLAMVIGMISTIILDRTILRPAAVNPNVAMSGNAKLQAVASLILWFLVITAGRMMAYT